MSADATAPGAVPVAFKRVAVAIGKLGFRNLAPAKWAYQWALHAMLPRVLACKIDDIEFQLATNAPGMGIDMARGRYEPMLTRALKEVLGPGARFVDVGAHVGYFTLLASKLVGDAGEIVSLEPEPGSYQLLAQNVERNGRKNVTLLQVAAAEEDGRGVLFQDRAAPGYNSLYPLHTSGGRFVDVETMRLATLARPDVVKIDAEGAEMRVLMGMRAWIEDRAPLVLFVELNPARLRAAGTSCREIATLLAGHGFELSIVDEVEHSRVSVTPETDFDRFSWANLVAIRRRPSGGPGGSRASESGP